GGGGGSTWKAGKNARGAVRSHTHKGHANPSTHSARHSLQTTTIRRLRGRSPRRRRPGSAPLRTRSRRRGPRRGRLRSLRRPSAVSVLGQDDVLVGRVRVDRVVGRVVDGHLGVLGDVERDDGDELRVQRLGQDGQLGQLL
ncbi:unnamed protein product, partial [Ixodes hexagonus]